MVTCKNGCADSTRDFSNGCACNSHTYPTVEFGTCDQTCSYKCGDCFEDSAKLG